VVALSQANLLSKASTCWLWLRPGCRCGPDGGTDAALLRPTPNRWTNSGWRRPLPGAELLPSAVVPAGLSAFWLPSAPRTSGLWRHAPAAALPDPRRPCFSPLTLWRSPRRRAVWRWRHLRWWSDQWAQIFWWKPWPAWRACGLLGPSTCSKLIAAVQPRRTLTPVAGRDKREGLYARWGFAPRPHRDLRALEVDQIRDKINV